MKNEVIKSEKFYLPCECGCSIMQFDKYDEEGVPTTYGMHYSLSFYEKQPEFFQRLKNILKFLFILIKKKEYIFYDMVIYKDHFESFKEFINKV